MPKPKKQKPKSKPSRARTRAPAPPKVRTKPRPTPPKSKPVPPPPAPPAAGAYEQHKERARERIAQASKSGRDIAPLPAIGNLERRLACRESLALCCKTYNPETFSLPWSDAHLQAIARIEEAAKLGAMYVFAMPRGSGKTAICRMAALWAVAYGWCRYVFLIGATQQKAEESLAAIKKYARLPAFSSDFPEIAYPIIRIAGVANRAAGQLHDGRETFIEVAKDRLVLPTIFPGDDWPAELPRRSDGAVKTSGAVIAAAGLTSESLRGSLLTLSTGEEIRPDLVLPDDPQTPESAWSLSQNDTRERLIAQDVLGMAGPTRRLAMVMPCTVIAPNDMVDRALDRTKHPRFRGQRTKRLPSMPKNLSAWDQYADVYRRCQLKEPPDLGEANAYYRAHRAELDEGAVCYWPERMYGDEVSAIQSAMHRYIDDPRGFWAEDQNAPLIATDEEPSLSASAIQDRLNKVPRGQVGPEAVRLTAFIDVQKTLLYYVVAGWSQNFSGGIVEYGSWPDQSRQYFTLRDAKFTLATATKVAGLEGQVYAGLEKLCDEILGREWQRLDRTGMRIERCLIDAGDQTDLVMEFCRKSRHSALILPSFGRYIGPNAQPLPPGKLKPGERGGLNWQITRGQKRTIRHVLFDANWWKTFLKQRLTTAIGNAGALELFGDEKHVHAMLADHCCAENCLKATGRRVIYEWKLPPNKPDNHLWDCLSGSAVAAAIQGCALEEMPIPKPRPRRKINFAETARRKKLEQERRTAGEDWEDQ